MGLSVHFLRRKMKLMTLSALAILSIFIQNNSVRGLSEREISETERNSRLIWCLKQMKFFVSEFPNEQKFQQKDYIKSSCRKLLAEMKADCQEENNKQIDNE